jgi:alpha-tubulin suppressor-like RCC1 family protein
MSNVQFHNKLHRTNHFTVSAEGFPDSAVDPIASADQPFIGLFYNSIVGNISGNSQEWQSNFSTTKSYSAEWSLYPSVSTAVKSSSSNWNDGYNFYTSLLPVSNTYESTYTTLTSNSSQYFLTNLFGHFTNKPQINIQSKTFAGITLTPFLSVNRVETFLVTNSSIPISAGQIFGTGSNLEGQIGINDFSVLAFTGVISGKFDNINACSVGNHTLALSSGSLFVTGRNDTGQLGLSSIQDSYSYVYVDNLLPGLINIAAGGSHSVVLSSNNKILVTGSNSQGQLGLGNTSLGFFINNFTAPITGSYINIAAGDSHTLALSSTLSGSLLFATGRNTEGQLGIATNDSQSSLTTVMSGYFSDIACGLNFSLALSSGSIYATGDNCCGQLGLGDGLNRKSFTLAYSGNFTKIACGAYHSVALSGSTIFATGDNSFGQLGTGFISGLSSFTPLPGNYSDVACGAYHTLALSSNKIFLVGRNDSGQLGNGTALSSINFVQPVTGFFDKIAAGESFSLALPLSTQTVNSVFTTVSSFSGTMYWSLSSEQNAFCVLTASYTEIKNPTGMLRGGEYYLTLNQNISGNRIVKFDTGYKFTDDIDNQNQSNVINLSSFGTTVYRFISDGQYMYGKVRKYIFGFPLMYIAGPGIVMDPNPTDSTPGDQFLSNSTLTIFDLAPYYSGLGITILYGE